MFLHVVSQFLASIAILKSVLRFGPLVSILLTMVLIGIFVISGGISGAGLIGKIKFFMLYIIMVVCAGVALYQGGGLHEIINRLPQDHGDVKFCRLR